MPGGGLNKWKPQTHLDLLFYQVLPAYAGGEHITCHNCGPEWDDPLRQASTGGHGSEVFPGAVQGSRAYDQHHGARARPATCCDDTGGEEGVASEIQVEGVAVAPDSTE